MAMNFSGGLGTRKRGQSDMKKEEMKLRTQFSYNRLWKLLIDRGLKKQDLQKMSHVSAASIAKMGRCENVTTEILLRICEALDCEMQDIMERVEIPNNNEKQKSTEEQ